MNKNKHKTTKILKRNGTLDPSWDPELKSKLFRFLFDPRFLLELIEKLKYYE